MNSKTLHRLLATTAALTALTFSAPLKTFAEGGTQGPVKVNLIAATGFTANERAKLDKAIVIFETVINSEEFKQRILNYTYQKKQQFVQNGGQTNLQIFETMMAGKETFTTQADSVADFNLNLYTFSWFKRGVVGETNPGTSKISMNRRFYSSFQPYQIAANMIHEWCHKIGYDHDYKSTARRPYSVPYAVGNLMSELGKKISN